MADSGVRYIEILECSQLVVMTREPAAEAAWGLLKGMVQGDKTPKPWEGLLHMS